MLFRYTGQEFLTYPYARVHGVHQALHAFPGMEPVELDEAPDRSRWEPILGKTFEVKLTTEVGTEEALKVTATPKRVPKPRAKP